MAQRVCLTPHRRLRTTFTAHGRDFPAPQGTWSGHHTAYTALKEKITMDWRHKAICRSEDPELFFPVGNSGPALAQIAKAKLVCNKCPDRKSVV